MRLRVVGVVALSLVSLGVLAGCGGGGPAGPGSTATSGDGPVAVVASTDVWGSVVQAVGGDQVQVTSIIDDPDKDPHEYEASARNQLALTKAQLVVQNGGGYDDFVTTMLSATKADAPVINAADVSGKDQHPADGEFNEHVWYDFPTVAKVTDAIASDLSTIDPARKPTFTANATAFRSRLSVMEQTEASIKAAHDGDGVAITEPVPVYLLTACGLVDKTPEAFSEAIEEGSDVAPAVLNQTLALFDDKQVKLLAYNEQTSGPQTEAVLNAAKKNSIAVVPVTETLPAGQDYLTWMTANLKAVSTALGS